MPILVISFFYTGTKWHQSQRGIFEMLQTKWDANDRDT